MTKSVAVITGSLRESSINRKLAHALDQLAAGSLAFTHLSIGDLPLYNEDLWQEVPAPVATLKAQIERADGVLIVSPEYNRGFPGIIGNAFDWASRPAGNNSWRAKPVAICGTTRGATGTAAGQQHLRLAAVNLSMVVMHQPELYVTWTDERFEPDGTIRNDDTRKLMMTFIDSFADWIARHG